LREQLIDFASLIELELDFAEEDVEFANRSELRGLILNIQSLIQSLLQSFQLGNVIKNGVATVIAGRPNAGKSTLLNALLNEERAIVSEIAGTTRDTIEEALNISGVPFRIIDTAGIREAHDQVEALGVERTMEKVKTSALLVYVFDVIKTGPAEVQRDLRQLAQPGVPLLVVANKMDLNPYTTWEQYAEENDLISQDIWVPVSAINRMNIDYLKEKLYEAVITEQISLENPVVTNARHFEALQKAHQSLDDVLRGSKPA
jgi:tRNA modification GTPase